MDLPASSVDVAPALSIRARRGLVARRLVGLALALVAALLVAVSLGAYHLGIAELVEVLLGRGAPLDREVLTMVRLPRVLAGALLGAALATAGALLQAALRNPLADPTLMGVSGGATLGASAAMVLGAELAWVRGGWPSLLFVPVAAFGGAMVAIVLVWGLATREGRARVVTLLLAGTAITAISFAATGAIALVATDAQLRALSLWNLGSVNGASWRALAVMTPPVIGVLVAARRLAPSLDAMALGEREATHLGVDVHSVKRAVMAWSALAVGVTVAVAGQVAFVGLMVPHLVRLTGGPTLRWVLPASALGGALLAVVADLVARIVVAPVDLPLGMVTALLGAPYFLFLLRREQHVEAA